MGEGESIVSGDKEGQVLDCMQHSAVTRLLVSVSEEGTVGVLQGSGLQSSRPQGETRRAVPLNGRMVLVRRTGEPGKQRPRTTTHANNATEILYG